MQVNMQEFLDAVAQANEVVDSKSALGILLNIADDQVKVCYANSNTVSFMTVINAVVTPEDPRGKVAFDYDPLMRVLSACKTTGKIKTDELNINFNSNGICKLTAERYIEVEMPKDVAEANIEAKVENHIQDSNNTDEMLPSPVIASESAQTNESSTVESVDNTIVESSEDFAIVKKVVSTIEQTLSWYNMNHGVELKRAALVRGRYEALMHLPKEVIDAYKAQLIASGVSAESIAPNTLPIEESHWEEIRDAWDINELQTILSRLSVEQNQILYISADANKAFVYTTTKGTAVLDVESDIQNDIVITTNMAKSISSILSKLKARGIETVYVHTETNSDPKVKGSAEIVFMVEDNSFALRIVRQVKQAAVLSSADMTIGSDYSQYSMMFSKDAFLSVINGAKELSASDSVEFRFEPDNGMAVLENAKSIKMVASVTNTNKSADNRYDINAFYAIDSTNHLEQVRFSGNVNLISSMISRMTSDTIAFDMNETEQGGYRIRIGEIDEDKRMTICENYGIDAMDADDTVKYRTSYLGLCCYTTVSKAK